MTVNDLNHLIDETKKRYDICDSILNHYKQETGEYPKPKFLRDERARLSKHLYKSQDQVEFIEKIRLTLNTIYSIGWQTYIDTM